MSDDEIIENLRRCLGNVPMDYHYEIKEAVDLIERLMSKLNKKNHSCMDGSDRTKNMIERWNE